MILSTLKSEVLKIEVVNEEDKVILGEALFQRLITAALKNVDVDDDWYLKRYPDVKEAISHGNIGSSREHFVSSGYYEGRLPRRIEVDSIFYLSTNPDVAAAINQGILDSPQQHFDGPGYAEGRAPYLGFCFF